MYVRCRKSLGYLKTFHTLSIAHRNFQRLSIIFILLLLYKIVKKPLFIGYMLINLFMIIQVDFHYLLNFEISLSVFHTYSIPLMYALDTYDL